MRSESEPIDRRSLLRRGALLGGAALFGGALPPPAGALRAPRRAGRRPQDQPDSILNHPAVEAPIDTVVVLMMENRSVDHHLGWLATDEAYLEDGRRRYGHRFHIDAEAATSSGWGFASTLPPCRCDRDLPPSLPRCRPQRGCTGAGRDLGSLRARRASPAGRRSVRATLPPRRTRTGCICRGGSRAGSSP